MASTGELATRDTAGRRYAAAILEIANADGDAVSWLAAVEALESLTSESRFVEALQADGMTDERFDAIVQRVGSGLNAKQMNMFRLLRRKGRLGLGPSVASYFREMLDAERGVLRAVVTTAVELDDARREAVVRRIAEQTGRAVEVETRVDPSILGGMVVRIGDYLVDGSSRARLRGLRSQLERAAM